ncbi:hypothetical protein [Streptomyces sp. NPDC001530]|uniref:hypothetical protein n=1 Tax=Streptomyces sp. NPDC001530 TaxID=3364582 RepID=UPI0036B1F608
MPVDVPLEGDQVRGHFLDQEQGGSQQRLLELGPGRLGLVLCVAFGPDHRRRAGTKAVLIAVDAEQLAVVGQFAWDELGHHAGVVTRVPQDTPVPVVDR